MVFRAVAITVAVFSAIIGNVIGSLPIPGGVDSIKEKFKINMVTIDGTPNEFFSYTNISPDPEHFSSTTQAHIIKTLPEDLMLRVVLKYQGQDVPPVEFPVCPGMQDKVFVDDVVSKGLPKETFPRACPIQPGNYTVEHWEFPHYKIPPGTPPGPVIVDVYLERGDNKEVIFHLYSEGEVVIDTSGVPKVPLGK